MNHREEDKKSKTKDPAHNEWLHGLVRMLPLSPPAASGAGPRRIGRNFFSAIYMQIP